MTAQQLRQAIEDCSCRGLVASAKWAAEQLVAFQTVTEDPIPCHSHRYLLAKTYFDAREYQRTSFVLQNEKDHQSLFLSGYSKYLHVQSQQQYLNPSSMTGMSTQVPKDLMNLCSELDHIQHKDAFLLYLSGIVRIKLKRVQEGKEALIQSLMIYPYNWSAWLELGTTIDNVEALDTLLGQFHPSFASYCFKVQVLNDLHQHPDMVGSLIEDLMSSVPKSRFLQIHRAVLYHNSRDFEESEILFEQLARVDPYLIESMDCYSNVLYVRRKYAKLCDLAHRMSIINRYRPETCACIGNYYSMKGEREKAIESFSRALKLDPNYSPAWTLLGHEYVDSCNPKAAIEVYRKAVDINPRDYRAWYGLGQAYDLLSLPSYSIYYHQRAIAIRPNDGRMWGALSSSLEATGRLHEAINCLKQVMVSQDTIEPPEFGKCAQLYQKLYELESNPKYESCAAYYYRKYIQEHQKLSEISNGEYVDDANLFLTKFHRDRGEIEEMKKYKSQLVE